MPFSVILGIYILDPGLQNLSLPVIKLLNVGFFNMHTGGSRGLQLMSQSQAQCTVVIPGNDKGKCVQIPFLLTYANDQTLAFELIAQSPLSFPAFFLIY